MRKLFDKFDLQVVSSRINEVHCGILKQIKRYRNKCGMTALAKAVAFTLAETLVVMGIIGVVAALTIPNLNQSTGDREKVAKVKKIYSNLNDAFGRATAVYGPVEEWFANDSNSEEYSKRFAERLIEFMKISKNCGTTGEGEGCYDEVSEFLGGYGSMAYDLTDAYNVLLADGTAISFRITYSNCDNTVHGDMPIADLCTEEGKGAGCLVDIDGPNKGQNTMGKDVFEFIPTKEGFLPAGFAMSEFNYDAGYLDSGVAATAWVIDFGNMDYLKNEGTGKCPDGTELSSEHTSCK